MTKQISIKTKLGWVSAYETNGKIFRIKCDLLKLVGRKNALDTIKHADYLKAANLNSNYAMKAGHKMVIIKGYKNGENNDHDIFMTHMKPYIGNSPADKTLKQSMENIYLNIF